MENQESGPPRRRDLPEPLRILALFLALAAVLASLPYVGQVRAALGDEGVRAPVLSLFAVAGVLFLLAHLPALRRRRERRLGLLAFLVLFAATFLLLRGPNPAVGMVEKVHLLEYGVLSALFYWAFRQRSPGREIHFLAVVFSVLAGLLDEYVQHLLPIRVGEIRDVWINLLSGLLGQAYVLLVVRPRRQRRDGFWPAAAASLGAVALLLLGLGLFLWQVQLGHLLRDRQRGVAVCSGFSAAELLRENREHRAAWRAAGKRFTLEEEANEPRLWALEDFFVTEARRHVGARNHLLDTGRPLEAAKEERILGRFYPAYLEVTSQQLPPVRRQALMRTLRGSPSFFYASPEMGHLITAVTASTLWAILLPPAILCLAAAAVAWRAARTRRAPAGLRRPV